MDEPSLLLRSAIYHFGGGDAFYVSLLLLIAVGCGLRQVPGAMPISRSRMGMRALSRHPTMPATRDSLELAVPPA